MITLKQVIEHSRDRGYMSGIERDQLRIKATSEVFTPTPLVQKLLNDCVNPDDIGDDFLDPSCGDGQILTEILIRKLERVQKDRPITDSDFEQALKTVYGVDLMQDNVDLCRDRLLCGQEQYRHIVEQNIQCKNALTYGFTFEPMGPARRKTEDENRAKQQRQLKKRRKEEHQKQFFT